MSKSTAITKADVWRTIAETDRQIQELGQRMELRDAETNRQIHEIWRRIERLIAETDRQIAETDRQVAETSRDLKEARNMFESRWGQMVESLVAGDLVRLLQDQEMDINIINTNQRGARNYIDAEGRNQHEQCELDIVAMNGKDLVVVEVKSTLNVKYVNRFLRLLPRIPLLIPAYQGKNLYGAVAYLRSHQNSHLYAARKGLFVIRATGDSASIINKEGFKPEVFS